MILDWSKLKACADDKIHVTKKLKCVLGRVETLWEKEKILVTSIFSFSHNGFSSTGHSQQAYVMACCLSCVRPSLRPCVRVLTFSLNIFSETTYQILMKFHRNVPTMVLLKIS